MCVVVAPAVAWALVAASVAATTYASYKQQKAENDAADYNSKMQKYNASVAQAQATSAKAKGDEEAAAIRRQVSQTQGAQRSAFAANGVEVDSGSSLDVLSDTARAGKLDELQVQKNAADAAWGYQVDATNYQGQATLSQMKKSNPTVAAGTTFLSGASNMATTFMKRT